MKHPYFQHILMCICLLADINVFAYNAKINGIYYDFSGNEATVTRDINYHSQGSYSGNVVIPESVTYNGKTYSVTSIGWSAFERCSGLTAVTIPNSVTSIGAYAFFYCSSLTTIIIPNSVTSIDYYAFYGCASLTFVGIGNSVESIGDLAFSGCSGLTSVTIPNSVMSIGIWAFDCGNKYGNAIYVGNDDNPYRFLIHGGEGDFINDLCEFICPWAFYGHNNLTSITIPISVISIGREAFYGCENLTSIIVKTNNTTFDSRENCNAIIESATNTLIVGCKNTIIPNSVTTIGIAAFEGCSGLTSMTIPNSVMSIEEGAFESCTGLTSVTIGNGVISYAAFRNCSSLSSVNIGNGVTSIGEDAFIGCRSLSDVYCYAKDVPKTYSHWGRYSNPFENSIIASATLHVPAGSLNSYKTTEPWSNFGTIVAIEDDISNITFADANVKQICVSNWDTNGDGELSKTEAASVTDLGTVFKNNKQISTFDELQYFTGLRCIDYEAFAYCTNLTSITIPNNVTSIGQYAFEGCSSFEKVIVSDLAAWCGISFGNDSANPLFCGHHLYSNESTEITDLVIPNKVTSISNYAFCGCSGLTSITIPIVGVSAFTVGMKVKITGKLMKYVKNGEVTPEIMKADVVVLEQGEGGGGQGGDDSGGQGGGGDPVTDLTNGDFENWVSDSEPAGWKSASSASNATLSKSTDARGGNFSCMVAAPGTQNKRLATQEMTLEAGSYTFSYYAKSTTGDKCQTRGGYVPVNADGSVGAYTYKKTYTDLNNSGWTLVSYDFELSSKATLCLVVMNPKGSSYSVSQDILVDDATLTKNNIRKAAATGSSPDDDVIPITCAEAVELTNMLADGETSTETYSITGYITEVIGNVSRNQQSFWMADTKDGGKVLEAYWANLPEGVTNIGYKAFSSCKGLKEIYCFAEETPQVDSETFYDIQPREILLVVPDVAVEQYKAHPIWRQFWIETPTGVRLAPAISHGNDIRYDLNGRKLNALQKGINIIRYSDGTTRKVLIK